MGEKDNRKEGKDIYIYIYIYIYIVIAKKAKKNSVLKEMESFNEQKTQ